MNWKHLLTLLESGREIKGLEFFYEEFNTDINQPAYRVKEKVGDYNFDMLRLPISRRKITRSDDLGLVGLNSLDLTINHCYLTEGVSDFMSLKLMKEGTNRPNVLGVTTLGGNSISHKILFALFDHYTIMGDNDQTGIKNIREFRTFLVKHGKTVNLELPEPGFNDISAQFMKQR